MLAKCVFKIVMKGRLEASRAWNSISGGAGCILMRAQCMLILSAPSWGQTHIRSLSDDYNFMAQSAAKAFAAASGGALADRVNHGLTELGFHS